MSQHTNLHIRFRQKQKKIKQQTNIKLSQHKFVMLRNEASKQNSN
jgi:hypothetical protein